MSQLSFPRLVHRGWGVPRKASTDWPRPNKLSKLRRHAVEQKMPCSPSSHRRQPLPKYLRTKLAGFEHEMFVVMFLDCQHRLIEYAEMFRGTITKAAVYPREVVKQTL